MRSSAGNGRTRWEELKEVTRIVVEIATLLDDDGLPFSCLPCFVLAQLFSSSFFHLAGIDVHFLNRGSEKGVKKWKDVEKHFKSEPNGLTPLTEATKKAFSKQKGDRPLLVMIATDGVPNNLKAWTDVSFFVFSFSSVVSFLLPCFLFIIFF